MCVYSPQAPTLFVAKHTDGAGHVMKNIIDGMAVAAALHMNFGGAIEQGKVHGMTVQEAPLALDIDDHHHDMRPIAEAIFGKNSTFEVFRKEKRQFDDVIPNPQILVKKRDSFKPSANIYFPAASFDGPKQKYFTDQLRASMRSHLDSRPLRFASNKISVAIHLRRGEFGPKEAHILKDTYVFRLLEEIKRKFSNIDVHLWSTLAMPGYDALWRKSDFDEYKKRGVHVHLEDEDDLADLWAHMARAQIFIMSKSSFSYVPAVLNLNCVIRPAWVDDPLDNWMNGEEEEPRTYRTDFDACMNRAASAHMQRA